MSNNNNNSNFFDVIILGGGVSGVSSALHLLKTPSFRGSIGLLEGREDRLGGRIHSTKTAVEERKIEMGANWIHGIIGNPVYELLSRRGAVDPLRVGEGEHHEDDYQRPTWNIQARALDGKDVNSYWVRKVRASTGFTGHCGTPCDVLICFFYSLSLSHRCTTSTRRS